MERKGGARDMSQQFELLLAELQSNRLEVVLVPCRYEANTGGCVRVAVSRNCTWYRRFCARHTSSRQRRNSAVDTKIKRRDVERILGRLIAGLPVRSKYADELCQIAQRLQVLEGVA